MQSLNGIKYNYQIESIKIYNNTFLNKLIFS